ncbi:hypothetical protein D3P07_10740 [Paenibacillus sp. 1011MAR3C5]|uniref:hypothetical protein n=1 Tax=Paenibacillus sp. 1011MAR3C5 TaxID=1675787 RepID=UPI000E6CC53B|nr:hypothetical protein [Paenibacillus sp. 1011MAR3C5]RJE88472.1 hypothetical protein D3P07_10740 [Paenibacillus sp. 1011MAR3C5]
MDPKSNHAFTEVTDSLKQVERNKLLTLLKNPLESLQLTAKEWIYGALGLAVSFVGYLIWVLILGNKITGLLYSAIPFGGLFAPNSLSFAIFSRMFLLGLLSLVALLAALWLAGWWRSGAQPAWKLFAIRIGGIQYITGAGFLLSGILSFHFTLSMMALAITLLSTLALSLQGGLVASGVSKEKTASYLIAGITLYLVLAGVFAKLIL